MLFKINFFKVDNIYIKNKNQKWQKKNQLLRKQLSK